MNSFHLKCDPADLPRRAEEYVEAQSAKQREAEEEVIADGARAGERGYLEPDKFIRIARWKSPRPLQRYRLNTDDLIRAVSKKAFEMPGETDRVLVLTDLEGVSVRTATAILHLCYPKRYPLLDFRAMDSLGISVDETTTWVELHWLRVWPDYVNYCRELSRRSNVDMRTLDRALWQLSKRGSA